jgi:hypothetical protein
VSLIKNLSNAFMQILTPHLTWSRATGVYARTLLGLMPVGSLRAGAIFERIGTPAAALVNAGAWLVVAALAWVFVPPASAGASGGRVWLNASRQVALTCPAG